MDLVFLPADATMTVSGWFPQNAFAIARAVRTPSDLEALAAEAQKAHRDGFGVLDAFDPKKASALRQQKLRVAVRPQSMQAANAAVSAKGCDAVWISRFAGAAFDLQWFRMAAEGGVNVVVALSDVWSLSGAARAETLKFWRLAARLAKKAGAKFRVVTGAKRTDSVRAQSDLVFLSGWLLGD
jgi:hypothetical protein